MSRIKYYLSSNCINEILKDDTKSMDEREATAVSLIMDCLENPNNGLSEEFKKKCIADDTYKNVRNKLLEKIMKKN